MSHVIGKPGRRMRRYCGCKVGRKETKRGPRYVVSHPDTKMIRFMSLADYEACKDGDVCAYLPEPFAKR